MLLEQKVEVLCVSRNKKHLEERNYKWEYNKFIKVSVYDLTKGCTAIVNCLCDYCLEEGKETIIPKIYYKYIRDNVNSIIHKDACKKCQGKKLKESNLKTKGVEITFIPNGGSRKIDGNIVYNAFIDKGLIPLFKPDDYISNIQDLPYICPNHKELGIQYKTYANINKQKYLCRQCYIDDNKKENHYFWKGGISPLHNYLRDKIIQWKKDSMKECNYKCVITGIRFDDIHHLYGFDLILNELLQELNLELKEIISNYNDEELILLENKCIELHNKYPLGVCLEKNIHKLFHKVYGGGSNTPEQFEEFKTRLKSGEFDLFLKENNLTLNFV